jgi:16S rRNA (uracil1498-N3)-methyltransferase
MKRFYVRHNLKPGDIAHLSDSDSQFVIADGEIKIESIIEIATLTELFLAQITFIDKSTVEVEILKKLSNIKEGNSPIFPLTIIQSISNDSKFNFFIEKSVEIGVSQIIAVESEYSLLNYKKAAKKLPLWNKIIADAAEQSRNPEPTRIVGPLNINELEKCVDKNTLRNAVRICLATEQIDTVTFKQALKANPSQNYVIAIGPEKGWSPSDIELFTKMNFKFARLGGNILRTETAGIVAASIINYLSSH